MYSLIGHLRLVYVVSFRPRDYYHTCYCLSGLSVAQHFSEGRLSQEYILGSDENQLVSNPAFNKADLLGTLLQIYKSVFFVIHFFCFPEYDTSSV